MHCAVSPVLAQTFTEPFIVFSAKRFPGVPGGCCPSRLLVIALTHIRRYNRAVNRVGQSRTEAATGTSDSYPPSAFCSLRLTDSGTETTSKAASERTMSRVKTRTEGLFVTNNVLCSISYFRVRGVFFALVSLYFPLCDGAPYQRPVNLPHSLPALPLG